MLIWLKNQRKVRYRTFQLRTERGARATGRAARGRISAGRRAERASSGGERRAPQAQGPRQASPGVLGPEGPAELRRGGPRDGAHEGAGRGARCGRDEPGAVAPRRAQA